MKIFYDKNWEPYSIMLINKHHKSFKKLTQELSKWYVCIKQHTKHSAKTVSQLLAIPYILIVIINYSGMSYVVTKQAIVHNSHHKLSLIYA